MSHRATQSADQPLIAVAVKALFSVCVIERAMVFSKSLYFARDGTTRSLSTGTLQGVPALNQALVDFGAREGSKLSCCEEAVYV